MKNDIPSTSNIPHNAIIEGREKLSITGVLDVESFDENEIIAETTRGAMIINGEDLRIEKLSIETGDAVVEGLVCCIEYSDKRGQKGSFWSKIF